jgi:hypothetical protein
MKVAHLLHDQHDRLQSNRKTQDGADHPGRDAKFRRISAEVKKYLREGLPVITSVQIGPNSGN